MHTAIRHNWLDRRCMGATNEPSRTFSFVSLRTSILPHYRSRTVLSPCCPGLGDLMSPCCPGNVLPLVTDPSSEPGRSQRRFDCIGGGLSRAVNSVLLCVSLCICSYLCLWIGLPATCVLNFIWSYMLLVVFLPNKPFVCSCFDVPDGPVAVVWVDAAN